MITFYIHNLSVLHFSSFSLVFLPFSFLFSSFQSNLIQVACHENADKPSIFIEHLINAITEHVNDIHFSAKIICNVHSTVYTVPSLVWISDSDISSQKKIHPFHFMTIENACGLHNLYVLSFFALH